MSVYIHRCLELLLPPFRRAAATSRVLAQQVEILKNTNRELNEQSDWQAATNLQLQQQVDQQVRKNADLRAQVERRNQIREELEERLRKQQTVVEKLTKRLEAVQLEREAVYKQYNRVLKQTLFSKQTLSGDQSPETVGSEDNPVIAPISGDEWCLNIGCGNVKKPGYLNVDVDPSVKPDLVVALDFSLPFASETFVLIEAYHVIEHIYPWLSVDVLNEFRRILKPQGKLVIECPNIESACTWLLPNADYGSDSQMGMWALYGDPNPKNPLQMHRWGYTPITLGEVLKQAGFVSILREIPQTHVPARDFRMTGIKP